MFSGLLFLRGQQVEQQGGDASMLELLGHLPVSGTVQTATAAVREEHQAPKPSGRHQVAVESKFISAKTDFAGAGVLSALCIILTLQRYKLQQSGMSWLSHQLVAEVGQSVSFFKTMFVPPMRAQAAGW